MFIQKGIICESFIKEPIWGKSTKNCVFTRKVKFPAPYKQPPFVQLSVEMLDSGAFIEQSNYTQNNNKLLHTVTRYDVSAQDVSGSEFTLRVSTWSGNAIYGFRIAWIAFGERLTETKSKGEELKDNLLEYLMHEMKKIDNTQR